MTTVPRSRALCFAAACGLVGALGPRDARAASPFVDETKRAFTVSVTPYATFGPTIAREDGEPPAALRLGGRIGVQPAWFVSFHLDAAFVARLSSAPSSPARLPGRPDFLVVSPQIALRPPSGWVEIAGGPALSTSEQLPVGAIARVSILAPLSWARLGPGVELAHLGGNGTPMNTVSLVLSLELGLVRRGVGR